MVMRLRSTERSEQPGAIFIAAGPGEKPEINAAGPIQVDPLVVAVSDPEDRLAVQARDIQSTLAALRLADGRAPSSIAVLTVGAVDEAAILTANVAVSAALSGLRTLLVDMKQSDFVQHRLLGQAPVTPTDPEDDLHAFIRPASIPRLSLLAAASDSRGLADMMADFDLCLVDASHVEDLALAAAGAEVAILAVSRDATTTADLKSTINKLSMLGMPLIGTVMIV
ncbi:hypothetical protein Sj15T_36350 [Sphingobium sp. TA15]|uniref:Tyrosine-protein kinase family protein n=2 Tax=Sphingomonadaceae TaxID=41297 RepID=D4Z7U1_SPHIU|nr:hypothetical protein SJA_C2-01970 [Sphingobium indicum UT26S]BDD68614.1 hypothetical protein Sj15T_36350 [Sphingobium sp. TA15]